MTPKQHILQVSELTKKVRFILESELNTVWLCGEISNFVAASSGHWYLSLKDSKSQVRCAMFKGNNSRVRIKPSNGKQVLVRAKVSLYEPRGDFQLIIDQMDDAGEGLLQQQYDALKKSLNAQGLFGLQHKQPLPKTINTVGIVTSPTGAAVKDIISVLKRRSPATNIILYPALVQGKLATQDICLAIQKANQRQECDVLIVGRGGGSLEDLWCFNEEAVVHAIFNSTTPIVSAVGHEIDTTLSDYVADLRAPTPSAAAELVSRDQSDIIDKFNNIEKRLQFALQNRINIQKRLANDHLKHLLKRHPEQRLVVQAQKADELTQRLTNSTVGLIKSKQILPQQLSRNLIHLSPQANIDYQTEKLKLLEERLSQSLSHKYQQEKNHFVSMIEQLQLVSPLATIARGYSVTRNEKGKIVKSVNQVKTKDRISIQLSDGQVDATIN
ncbi:exodeoxyribonuclease VII large subunit [Thalassotalea atypica]|uniref:exodeoxyribonuclease VII large subunit n=1 Tax=Thalassotalea atypica TaxID=2054316 RepID=UPI00257223DF|nr:exodeoxyribonuclease VII large subunit [Thalassotalea atypica]